VSYLENTIYHNISAFCSSLQGPDPTNLTCPLSPGPHAFGANVQLDDSYDFGVLIPTFQVLSPDLPPLEYVCLTFQLTPRLTPALTIPFSIVPLVIVLLVGFASLFAARFNPWTGSANWARTTSNFGQDPDALRLVTPGFGDAWYYVQFAVYTACLSLDYPGVYQPVLSRVAWSQLLFNTTLVYGVNGTVDWSTTTESITGATDLTPPALINAVNGSDYGLTQYAALVGIPGGDVWPTFMVWFLLVLVGIVVATECAFMIYWVIRQVRRDSSEDWGFGTLNLCFLAGMLIRIWQLFYIVIVTVSCYQLVIGSDSPPFQIGLSVITLILLGLCLPILLIWIVSRHQHLFADLNVLLALGPMYNTYADSKVLFCAIVFIIRLFQGIVIGAAQASGIAQITLLALLEIVFLVALNIWRPFHRRTSMNGWHTFMACVRLLVLLFLIAFIPSLNVSAGVRGWIGYTLLVIHGVVLIFVFLLNVIQTLVEISARLAGAGEDSARREREFGLANVFGINQLMRRQNSTRRPTDLEYVDGSGEPKAREEGLGGAPQQRNSRNSSQGGSSFGLMDTTTSYTSRVSSPQGPVSPFGPPVPAETRNALSPTSTQSSYAPYFPAVVAAATIPPTPLSPLQFDPVPSPQTSPTFGPPSPATTDPRVPAYYRPPRRSSHIPLSPTGTSTRFDPTTERTQVDAAVRSALADPQDTPIFAPPARPRTNSPRPSTPKPRPNYAVREADAFYYRRPDYSQPLNPGVASARRLGTGPADPTGPIAIAGSWLRGLFRGNPDKGKFEVVRGNAARTEIPLEQNPASVPGRTEGGDSRPSSAGRGEDVRSPLVIDTQARIPEEEGDETEEHPHSPQPSRPQRLQPPLPFQTFHDDEEEEEEELPLPPAKNPNRASVSSFEDMPPSIPRKSSQRSPRVDVDVPRVLDGRVGQVRVGKAIWTEAHDSGSKESVGEVRYSGHEEWSDEE
jgi:Transient receptor potential (TRP) ion channel